MPIIAPTGIRCPFSHWSGMLSKLFLAGRSPDPEVGLRGLTAVSAGHDGGRAEPGPDAGGPGASGVA
jgi:hypothetical protein